MAFNFVERLAEGDALTVGTLVFAAIVGFAAGAWAYRLEGKSTREVVREREEELRGRIRNRDENGPLT